MTRSSPPSVYDEDFFAWTQQQAAALRKMPREPAGDRVDVAHVAEEIADLGKRDLRQVASFLGRLIEHLIKISSCAESPNVPHWRSEARHFQGSALDAFSPSMRQFIDLPLVWRRGRKRAAADLSDMSSGICAPGDCPFALDELLTEDFDLDHALTRLAVAKDGVPLGQAGA